MVDLVTANAVMTGDWAVSWVEDLLNKPELTPAGKILLLLDEAPRCGCGASCALLRYLTGQMTVIRKHENYQAASPQNHSSSDKDGVGTG